MPKKRGEKKSASQRRRSQASRGRRVAVAMGVVALATGLAVAFFAWSGGFGGTSQAYALAPESALPAAVRQAPTKVQEAYRFALANRDTMRWIPCYCGCGAEGHRSNADCYIKDVKSDGSVVFDFMSLN